MKLIFLDRDGVINKYPGNKRYVTTWKEFKFLPWVKAAVAKLYKNRFKIFVVSNQAGVGKGVFSQDALQDITKRMLKEITRYGGKIEAVYYCTHRQEENCSCRKPKAGLIDIAKKKYNFDLRNSFFIGDTIADVNTAQAAGCKSILVLSGKEKLSNRKNWETQPDFVFHSLWEATKFILNQK
jgi:histidinol-phosphate phosphatase family protein